MSCSRSTLLGCPVTLVEFSQQSLPRGQCASDFQPEAAEFFSRFPTNAIDRALNGVAEGASMRADPLFDDPGSAWRLYRPYPMRDDPDALTDVPQQTHFLIRPAADAAYEALALVAVPEGNTLTWPAFAGRIRESGNLFTIEPTSPETCVLTMDTVQGKTLGDQVDVLLKAHLRR